MAVIGSVTLPPESKRWYTVSYPWLSDGETISSVTCESTGDDAAFVVHDAVVSDDGLQAKILAGGAGTDGTTYTLAVSIVTSADQESVDHIEVTIDSEGS